MIGGSLAALLLVSAAPSLPATGEREILDAFKSACARARDLGHMKADALASGWKPLAEGEEPRIARLLKMGRDEAEPDGKTEDASFRRSMGGRDLFLIVSRYEDKTGIWGAGCRLYDFSATAPLDGPGLEEWMGKPPTGVEVPVQGLSRRLWQPGWPDGVMIEVLHVAQNHPEGRKYGLSGNILTAEALGGF